MHLVASTRQALHDLAAWHACQKQLKRETNLVAKAWTCARTEALMQQGHIQSVTHMIRPQEQQGTLPSSMGVQPRRLRRRGKFCTCDRGLLLQKARSKCFD